MAANNPELIINSQTYLGRYLRYLNAEKLPDLTEKTTRLRLDLDALQLGSTAFDGNRVITRPGLPAIIPGGTNVVELLNNLLYPPVSPALSLALNRYLAAKGEKVDLVISGSAALNDGIAAAGKYLALYDATGEDLVLLNDDAATAISFSISDLALPASFLLELYTLNLGGKFQATAAISFASPMYYGVAGAGQLDQAQIEGQLTKITAVQGDAAARQQLNFTAAGQRMFFAYPKSYGALTGIIDPDNSNVLAGFVGQRYETQFSWTGFEPELYYVYFNDADFTATNFKLSFNL